MTVSYPGGHDLHAYSKTYTKSPAETKAVVDAAYAAARASYKSGQDAVAADFAEAAGLNPQLDSLSPTTKVQNTGTFTLTANGFDFAADAVISWNGNWQTTTRVSAKQLTASINNSWIVSAGSFPVNVVNASSGKVSNGVTFVVT